MFWLGDGCGLGVWCQVTILYQEIKYLITWLRTTKFFSTSVFIFLIQRKYLLILLQEPTAITPGSDPAATTWHSLKKNRKLNGARNSAKFNRRKGFFFASLVSIVHNVTNISLVTNQTSQNKTVCF